ncbi:glycosyltransferase [Microbacterium fluvii]|uniref:Glycosyltransferase n=1 Tax=Microbacterium fluvii TaxID=415215 RepID=A0ABW2H8Z3_9MICO
MIPTMGTRPDELVAAVRSVSAQRPSSNVGKVIVVLDDPSFSTAELSALLEGLSVDVAVIRSTDGLSARQSGVLAARSDWIAFLDDDDLWEPQKLEEQMRLAENTAGKVTVVACRVSHEMAGAIDASHSIPRRLMDPRNSVAGYLFRRRPPTRRRPSLFTSTLLVPRALCLEVPWRKIPRHQDWDWLVRADARPDVVVVQSPRVLVRIRVGSPGSISRSPDWRSSLEWAEETLAAFADRRIVADFLASQSLRYAASARSATGVRSVLGALFAGRRMPSLPALLVGLAGLLPTALIKRILRRG